MCGVQERRPVAALRNSRAARAVLAASVAAAAVVADALSTSWALSALHHPVHLLGPLGLGLQYNSGTAFSLLSGSWLLPVLLVLLVAVGWAAWRAGTRILAVGFGLVLGGALGNVADRFGHHGRVVDFVTLTHWPTFNVADACITVGVVLVACGYLFGGRRPSERPSPS